MAPSSPARSPPLCIPWAKSHPRHQAGPPDTLTAADLRERARTRRSVGLSRGAPRSYRLEERCVPPAGFSALRTALERFREVKQRLYWPVSRVASV
eukprot:scaffold18290_cov53-Phaeocystis_antarctica.AAC.2